MAGDNDDDKTQDQDQQDQDGQGGQDKEDGKDDATFDLEGLEDVELNLGGQDKDQQDQDQDADDKDQDGQDKDKDKAQDGKPKPGEPSQRERDLQTQLDRLQQDKNDLKRALHEARQEKKKKDDATQVLSDGELLKILEEHKDDPKTMMNVMVYKMQQMMKAGKADTLSTAEMQEKRRGLEEILRKRVPDLDDEAGPGRVAINKAKAFFGIEGHDLGDFLGAAAAVYANMDSIAAKLREEGRQAALKEIGEKNRQKNIDKNRVGSSGGKAPSGKPGDQGLTPAQLDTAKRLGLDRSPEKLRIYKAQILGQQAR